MAEPDVNTRCFRLIDNAQEREQGYRYGIERFTVPYVERRNRGEKHPVEDFLFTYYSFKPAQLLRWHPGITLARDGAVELPVLTGAAAQRRMQWRFYRELSGVEKQALGLKKEDPAVTVDLDRFISRRGSSIAFIHEISERIQAKPGNFSCFGLHEWAMVYQQASDEHRHEYLQLRLGQQQTDETVIMHKIRCSHIDAFRFFTPEAAPLNELQPTRATQRFMDQPGCLHANMDVYKWAYKLLPLVSSEFIAETFILAWKVRAFDMQASPYDLEEWGYAPIPIETPEGKAQYIGLQRGYAEQTAQLRKALLGYVRPLIGYEGVAVKE